MTKFSTHGVLSASTGILMGDIGELYKVTSYLLGRSAYTHELVHYSKLISKALIICHPELPNEVLDGTWEKVRDDFVAKWGSEMELDPALDAVLADDKNPVETLRDMGFGVEIITL